MSARKSPFHERTSELNETGLWAHWAGYLSAPQYHHSEKFEYFAVRTSAGVYDTSPLYKYRIHGSEAERFLSRVLTRDIRSCHEGQAHYTAWCDEEGFVVEDGVILRTSGSEFLLSAAEPNLAYLQALVGNEDVEIEDVSDETASLALQGPRSTQILNAITPDASTLGYFGVVQTEIAGVPVTVSRTGFTGDLGYELWIPTSDALTVWDAVFEAGAPHHLVPFGETALVMTRIEAGLLLIDVDFHPSRFAWSVEAKSTPTELGMGWMLRNIEDPTRPFIGREALRSEIKRGSRRELVGLVLDWNQWNETYKQFGYIPPKDHTPIGEESIVYDGDDNVGYATSFMYSPMTQSHIAIAQVKPDFASIGTTVQYEVAIDHQLHYIDATVSRMPFYNPPHKTA